MHWQKGVKKDERDEEAWFWIDAFAKDRRGGSG